MPEAKSILSQILAVLVGLVMLGCLSYIIYINSDIWHVIARQNDASKSIRNYSEYAAYDGTDVRGQDVMSLITKTQGDPFVVVSVGGRPTFTSVDAYTSTLQFSTLDMSNASSANSIGNLGSTVGSCAPDCFTWDGLDYMSTDSLQSMFLDGALSDGHKYASFKAYLIYDGVPSTNVVGILLEK